MKIIENSGIKYEKIYHISDIHIRNTENHIETYLHVFENLFTYLKKENVKKSLLVICGDILHSKDKLTPVSIKLLLVFIGQLLNIMPHVIIIAGNHDINERGLIHNNDVKSYDNDPLSSILYMRNLKNLHYLKSSGLYRFNNIIFSVMSLLDKGDGFINGNDIEEEGIKIALYHGSMNNAKNSHGFEFSSKSISIFDGYDYVLLGDIHKYQYLNDNKTIGYSSSLISQNFSETDEYHGVLVWDLTNKTSSYKIIDNLYRYDELDIVNNKIYYHKEEKRLEELILPKKGKLRINTSDNIKLEYNNIVEKIQLKFPELNIVHNKLIKCVMVDNKTSENMVKSDNSINNIIDACLNEVDETIRKDVKQILFKKINEAFVNTNEKSNWQLLSLEFTNMFGYGGNNRLDFTKLTFNDITALYSRNSSGKSSLIDILLFSLFDDYSRNQYDKNKKKSGSLINLKYKNFNCLVRFTINNKIYTIYREGFKRKAVKDYTEATTLMTKVEFNVYENDKCISLTCPEFINTNEKITKIIGTYDDFCLSSLCLQHNFRGKTDFLGMSFVERKNFLDKLIKLDTFTKIEEDIRKDKNNLQSELKNINKDLANLNYNNTVIENKINEYNKNIIQNTEELNNNIKTLNIYKSKSQEIYKQRMNVDEYYGSGKFSDIELSNMLEKEKNILSSCNNCDENISINNLYEENTKLLSQIEKTNINIKNNCELEELIKKNTEKIKNLELIKNKDKIINDNVIFEQNKKSKIIKLMSKLNENFIQISDDYNYNIDDLNQISSSIKTYDDTLSRNNITNILENLNTKKQNIITQLKNINEINNDIVVDDRIILLYKSINYNEYMYDIKKKLENFDNIEKTYLKLETNKDILIILDNFNNSININCDNCVKHSNEIKKYYNKLKIDSSYILIEKTYNDMLKLKNTYEQLQQHYINITIIELQQSIEHYDDLIKYYNEELYNLNIEKYNYDKLLLFKKNLDENIYNFQQNNIYLELKTQEQTEDINYTNLLIEQEIYESVNNLILDCHKQIKNNDLHRVIENNNVKIREFNIAQEKNKKSKDIIDRLTQTINNNQINNCLSNSFDNVNKQCEIYSNNIIDNEKNLLKYKYELEKISELKNKYMLLTKNQDELTKRHEIIKVVHDLVDSGGIPRKIMITKLEKIEENVNKIIKPFLNKSIKISKEAKDIRIYICDGRNKIIITGGMEYFIISLAFKICFTDIFSISHTGILIIDEGVSVLDKEHIKKFNIIGDFLKEYYNNIVLITHIDAFLEYTNDDPIKIIKKDGVSNIWYSNEPYNNIIKDNNDDNKSTNIVINDVSQTITNKRKYNKKQKVITV